ncbi:MAG: hypothetical protein H0T79_23200, partial [Deltaproteobacteria bacterium]|nr:hypothetical protein [Deltaproteobacteria bacterium]
RTRVGAFPFEIVQSKSATVSQGQNRDTQLAEAFDLESNTALRDAIRAYLATKPG